MKLTRVEAEGIFSFGVGSDKLVLDLDESLTVIVGPNASGKSNISRVLNLVQTAVRFDFANQEERTALSMVLTDHVRSALHDGIYAGAQISVRLDIELTSEAEIELMTVLAGIFVPVTSCPTARPAVLVKANTAPEFAALVANDSAS